MSARISPQAAVPAAAKRDAFLFRWSINGSMNTPRHVLIPLACTMGLIGAGVGFFCITSGNDLGRPRAAVLHDDGRPPRIVSSAPGITEILFALGAGDLLVGATDHCNYPPEARRIERIGGFEPPSLEKLLALAPDYVLSTSLECHESDEALRRAGIQTLNFSIRNFDELFDAVRRIGEATGRSPQAAQLIDHLRAELDAVTVRDGAAPRPKVFVEIAEHPLMTAGGKSFLDDLIRRAGGGNAAHDVAQPYFNVNPEQVLAWNPDVILLTSMDPEGLAASRLSRRIGWTDISAVRNNRVIGDVPPDLLLRPGPRLIDGVRFLAARLHPAAK